MTAVDQRKPTITPAGARRRPVVDLLDRDLTELGEQYDFILDTSAHRTIGDYARALAPDGTYVLIGGGMDRILQLAAVWTWRSRLVGKRMSLLLARANKDLDEVVALMEAGSVTPVIDRVFAFEEVPDAFRYYAAGSFVGKIVVKG